MNLVVETPKEPRDICPSWASKMTLPTIFSRIPEVVDQRPGMDGGCQRTSTAAVLGGACDA